MVGDRVQGKYPIEGSGPGSIRAHADPAAIRLRRAGALAALAEVRGMVRTGAVGLHPLRRWSGRVRERGPVRSRPSAPAAQDRGVRARSRLDEAQVRKKPGGPPRLVGSHRGLPRSPGGPMVLPSEVGLPRSSSRFDGLRRVVSRRRCGLSLPRGVRLVDLGPGHRPQASGRAIGARRSARERGRHDRPMQIAVRASLARKSAAGRGQQRHHQLLVGKPLRVRIPSAMDDLPPRPTRWPGGSIQALRHPRSRFRPRSGVPSRRGDLAAVRLDRRRRISTRGHADIP